MSSDPISLLASSSSLGQGLSTELPNILPFYIFSNRITSLDISSIFGRGILDSSIQNTNFILTHIGDTGQVHNRINPMASLPRLLLEGGLFSLILFCFFYFSGLPGFFSYPLLIQFSLLLTPSLYFVYRSDFFFLFAFLFHTSFLIHSTPTIMRSTPNT